MSGFGRYLEEFTVGEVFVHAPARTVTEGEHALFCSLTQNTHPLHVDHEYARQSQHGRVLVVGTYVFSLAVGMSVPDVSGKAIANLGYEAVVHLAPVFIGDTLSARTSVLGTRESRTKPDRGVVRVETLAANQHGEDVIRFRRAVLVPRRPR